MDTSKIIKFPTPTMAQVEGLIHLDMLKMEDTRSFFSSPITILEETRRLATAIWMTEDYELDLDQATLLKTARGVKEVISLTQILLDLFRNLWIPDNVKMVLTPSVLDNGSQVGLKFLICTDKKWKTIFDINASTMINAEPHCFSDRKSIDSGNEYIETATSKDCVAPSILNKIIDRMIEVSSANGMTMVPKRDMFDSSILSVFVGGGNFNIYLQINLSQEFYTLKQEFDNRV